MPRISWSWEEFERHAPPCSIALDGMVRGGPRFDEAAKRINFDHHDGVVRDATMSTVMQTHMAIKGDLMDLFGGKTVYLWINDTDQDTSHAVWFLFHSSDFAGTKSVPHVNRHLSINNKLDVTGGAYPIKLDDALVRKHVWIFPIDRWEIGIKQRIGLSINFDGSFGNINAM